MKQSPAEVYFRRYLSVVPLSLALQRAVEARYLMTAKIKRPVLDVGCGFGEFAGVFFERQVEMGVDVDYRELVNAAKSKKYRNLIRADVRKLPFESGRFSSVISVSTLEHIAGAGQVLKEIFRVLKPGGLLAFTVVTDKWDKHVFYGLLLRKIGLSRLGDEYRLFFNKVFKHKTLISKKNWEKHVLDAGFEIEESKEIASPKIATFFDLFLITAWPSQVYKLLVGRRAVLRPKLMVNLLTKIFLRYVEEESTEGTNLFVIARKPGN